MELGVPGLGLFQDGNFRVGVFPEVEEILVGNAGLGEGLRYRKAGLEGIGTGKAETS
jgi:hypothetical protein